MSLTIHYNGSFKNEASLPGMIKELKDIAEICGWNYHVFESDLPDKSLSETSYDQNLYGICLSPPESEPLWMCFLSNGKLSSPRNMQLWADSEDEKERRYLTMVSTKTQYAGVETHQVIIHLLKHISRKYFNKFELIDETGYWETGDEELLEDRFRQMNQFLDQVAFGLNNFPKRDEESFEIYFDRLLSKIQKGEE